MINPFDQRSLTFVLTTAIEDTDNRFRAEIVDWILSVGLEFDRDVKTHYHGEMYLRFEIITFLREEDALAFKLKFPNVLHLNFL